jgi:hypothetical protein
LKCKRQEKAHLGILGFAKSSDTIGDYNGAPGIGPGEPFNMQLALKIIFSADVQETKLPASVERLPVSLLEAIECAARGFRLWRSNWN